MAVDVQYNTLVLLEHMMDAVRSGKYTVTTATLNRNADGSVYIEVSATPKPSLTSAWRESPI